MDEHKGRHKPQCNYCAKRARLHCFTEKVTLQRMSATKLIYCFQINLRSSEPEWRIPQRLTPEDGPWQSPPVSRRSAADLVLARLDASPGSVSCSAGPAGAVSGSRTGLNPVVEFPGR
eukprot:GHVU01169685.1.p2 GENE.GHVU01169685.1~~GHVU01169685.1.p2  ORF type:complete len:118 (-),score=8.91 GHVU01169685.1:1029-1382(-)